MSTREVLKKYVESVAGKIVLYGSSIALIFAGGIWVGNFIDPLITTEYEAHLLDDSSMSEHVTKMESIPYAMADDVNHVLNKMVDEKIKDAQNEIKEIEDLEDMNEVTKIDLRQKKRLERDIGLYKNECIKDYDMHNHCK
jgi:hypothetical protein